MKNFKQLKLIMLYVAFVPLVVNADPLTYQLLEDDTVTVVDCDESASGVLAIPAKYKGKPVASIKDNTFLNCISLTGVTIPNRVTRIGYKAYNNRYSITNVKIT